MARQARKTEPIQATAEQQQVLLRLLAGTRLEGAQRTADGLIDLRGVALPTVSHEATAHVGVERIQGNVTLKGVEWRGLDLSGARLGSLRFFDSVIEDCRFDGADCSDWRMWGTRVEGCSFKAAGLRQAALGGVDGSKRNVFRRVDFSGADLRSTAHFSSEVTDCNFASAKLKKVDFKGTCFTRCNFEGKLDEVVFSRHGFRGEAFPANEMVAVDLSRATLVFVEFQNLDLSDVKWPDNAEHFAIPNYRQTLNRLIQQLATQTDPAAGGLSAVLEMALKWAGPKRQYGVMSRAELREIGGEGAVALFERLMTLQ